MMLYILELYDHKEFPGVVPRTFIGPLFISFLSSPIVSIFNVLSLNKFWAQYVVRSVLGLCVIISFLRFFRSVESHFGKSFSKWYLMVTVSQFHFMFYMTRPLPNIMAMPLVLLSLDSWFRRKFNSFIIFSGASIIWFRGELALFFGVIILFEFYHKSIALIKLIKIAVPVGVMLLSVTIAIDSVFWGRLLWPEGEVLWFNTILNKSSQWGTSPFLWYFYSAIPRGMAFSVLLVPLGAYHDKRVLEIILPSLIFVCLYSFLPHKELRFIIYVFPLLNVAAASICHKAWENREKSNFQKVLALGLAGHIGLNFLFTIFLLMIAAANYPGGAAMARIHRLESAEENVFLHIDNLSAQSGVSRFTEIYPNWRYSKRENLTVESSEMMEFTHLLIEAKSKYSSNLKPYQKTHEILESIEGFSQILLNYNIFPPIRIKTKPMIFIIKRKIKRENKNLRKDKSAEVVSNEKIQLKRLESVTEKVPEEDEFFDMKTYFETNSRKTSKEIFEDLSQVNKIYDVHEHLGKEKTKKVFHHETIKPMRKISSEEKIKNDTKRDKTPPSIQKKYQVEGLDHQENEAKLKLTVRSVPRDPESLGNELEDGRKKQKKKSKIAKEGNNKAESKTRDEK